MSGSKVSIIIPVYNGSNYLREAIDSALMQTYYNKEIIVVNDGSDDRGQTKKIILSYGEKIHYIEKGNGGVGSALNAAIKQMNGEYFSWLSHDDRYLPDKIGHQMMHINEKRNPMLIVYGGYYLINERGKKYGTVNIHGKWKEVQLQKPLFPLFAGAINGCTLLLHRDHFKNSGVFNEALMAVQDYDLWFRILRNAKVFCQPEIDVETRIHSQRGTNAMDKYKQEINSWWIKTMHQVTTREIMLTAGNKKEFYNLIVQTLKYDKNYTEACEEAKRLGNLN